MEKFIINRRKMNLIKLNNQRAINKTLDNE